MSFASVSVMRCRASPRWAFTSSGGRGIITLGSLRKPSFAPSCATATSIPFDSASRSTPTVAASSGGARGRYGSWCRNHSRQHKLLDDYERDEQQCEDDAMDEGAREYCAFLALQLGDCRAGRDVLRGDHLAHDTTG